MNTRLLTVAALSLTAAPAFAQYQAAPGQTAPVVTENPVKKALKEGRAVIGATATVGNPEVAAALAGSGFDFLWIEMEHGPLTLEGLRTMMHATKGLKAMPFTRVPNNEPWMAKRVLDMGSLGVIFPFVNSKLEAGQAVRSCKYPPLGVRGFGPGLAAARWGMNSADYVNFANENVLVIVMIETSQAVADVEEIASVPGVDVLMIGVNDLSFSLGVGGKTTEPIVEEAVAKVLAAGKKRGIPVGYPTGNPAEINKRIEQGFRFFQASSDVGLMTSGARELLGKVQRP